MYIKLHQKGDREVVAICDEDLLDKKFSDGDFILDINKEFYGGDKRDKKFIKEILLEAKNINLVGKNCIDLAIKLKIIDKSSVLKIKNIPYAFVFGL